MINKYTGKETSIYCPRLTKVIPGQKAKIHATIYFENSLFEDFMPTECQNFWCDSQNECRVPVLGTGGIAKKECHFWQNKLRYKENFKY